MNDYTLPLVAIFISIGGFAYQYFSVIGKLRERIAAIEVKTDLFWGAIEKKISGLLISDATPHKDELILKMLSRQISLNELSELESILDKEYHGAPDSLKAAYILFFARIEMLKGELAECWKE